MKKQFSKADKRNLKDNFNYCRSCYKHLAGFVGVTISETMEKHGYLKKSDSIYLVTEKGWKWFSRLAISKSDFRKARLPLTRQCIDVSERRPHLAGHLGAVFLERMLSNEWLEKTESPRELVVTPKGRLFLDDALGIAL